MPPSPLYRNYNTGSLNDVELRAVHLLDRAVEWCKESAVSPRIRTHTHRHTHTHTHTHWSQTREGVSPVNLAEMLQLAEEVKPISKLTRAIHLARKRGVFMSM